MTDSRDASNLLMRSVVGKILTDFNVANVPGISAIPTTIKVRPKPITPFPFIYVTVDSSNESDVNQGGSSRDYNMTMQLVMETEHNTTAEVTRDAIVDEVTRIMDSSTNDYIDLASRGFNVYIQTVTDVNRIVNDSIRAGTYYTTNIQLFIRADFTGIGEQRLPQQAPEYTYTGFFATPTSNRIEAGDAGTITVTETYPSNNRGWDFTGTDVVLPLGAADFLTDNVYTVNTTNTDIQLGVAINYELETDTATTTILNSTNTWARSSSLRYGSIAATGGSRPTFTDNTVPSLGLQLLSNWQGVNREIEVGVMSPFGQQITIQGQEDEYLYIVYDASQTNLTSINQDLFNADVFDRFEAPITTGIFKIYIATNPLTYDGPIILNLN